MDVVPHTIDQFESSKPSRSHGFDSLKVKHLSPWVLDVCIFNSLTGFVETVGLQSENPGAGLLTIEGVSASWQSYA